jgi:hypothetical protein
MEEAVVSYENHEEFINGMPRKLFLKLFAAFIVKEANENPNDETPEPYRAAGDRLSNEALRYID